MQWLTGQLFERNQTAQFERVGLFLVCESEVRTCSCRDPVSAPLVTVSTSPSKSRAVSAAAGFLSSLTNLASGVASPFFVSDRSQDDDSEEAEPRSDNKRGPYGQYSEAQFNNAVNRVLGTYAEKPGKKWSIRHAAWIEKVPFSTLRRAVRAHQSGKPRRKAGCRTALTQAEEAALIIWITVVALLGFPASKRTIAGKAGAILQLRGGKFRTYSGRASRSWWKSFRKRHPELVYKGVKQIPEHTARVSKDDLLSFWEKLVLLVARHQLKPDQIYNADETGVSKLGSDSSKALVPAELEAVRRMKEWREHVSLLFTTRADGKSLFAECVALMCVLHCVRRDCAAFVHIPRRRGIRAEEL